MHNKLPKTIVCLSCFFGICIDLDVPDKTIAESTKLLVPARGLGFSSQAFKARLGSKANVLPTLGSGST